VADDLNQFLNDHVQIVHVTVPPGSYERACAAAATDQGLDPIMAALKAGGFEPELWQSGGFCMIVTLVLVNGENYWIVEGSDYGAPAGKALVTGPHTCHACDEDTCPACHDDGNVVDIEELSTYFHDLLANGGI
jgi:hypothetical protein